jgi:hypothetical protein
MGFWFSPMHKEKVSTKFPTVQVRAIIPTQVLCFKIQSFNYQMWFYHAWLGENGWLDTDKNWTKITNSAA